MAKGKTPINTVPRSWASDVVVNQNQIGAGQVGVNELTLNFSLVVRNHNVPTIGTTASAEIVFLAPCQGTIASVRFTAKDALATSDTNYITFSLTNKGSGAGSTAVLNGTTGNNTTKATGGGALSAYTPQVLAANADGTHNAINRNDVLVFAATVTGTLANQVTEGCVTLTIVPSS